MTREHAVNHVSAIGGIMLAVYALRSMLLTRLRDRFRAPLSHSSSVSFYS